LILNAYKQLGQLSFNLLNPRTRNVAFSP